MGWAWAFATLLLAALTISVAAHAQDSRSIVGASTPGERAGTGVTPEYRRTGFSIGVYSLASQGVSITGPDVDCALGRLDLAEPATGDVMVMVRPEQLALQEPGGLTARVVSVTYHGPQAMVHLDLADSTTRLVARVPGDQLPHPDDKVGIAVPTPVQSFPPRS